MADKIEPTLQTLSRRELLRKAGSSLLFASLPFWKVSAPPARPTSRSPNILFICSDDQGWWSVGAEGNEQARTSHIDSLYRQGAHLKNSFVHTPVCSPSRSSLMTSRYAIETGITEFLRSGGKDLNRGLDPKFITWPEVFARAGYQTALIGKWHLGMRPPFHPTNHGFRHFIGLANETPSDPELEVSGKVKRFRGFTGDILTDFGIEFIRQRRQKPFLLCMHYTEPHASNAADASGKDRTWLPMADEDWAPFRDLDPEIPNPDFPNLDIRRLKRMTREYLASVASLDRNLGRLLALLDQLYLASNTIVIFTSDNGYNMGHNGIWHKANGWWILTNNRGDRPNLYDNSLRVPTAIRWPGVIQPGTVIRQTISNLDWYPTVLAAAGIPPGSGVTIRGRNFLPLLMGKKTAWQNDLYAEYSMRQTVNADLRMYRTPEWKLVRDFLNPGRDELYHLAKDPAESNNLISSPELAVQKTRQALETKVIRQMRELHDSVLK